MSVERSTFQAERGKVTAYIAGLEKSSIKVILNLGLAQGTEVTKEASTMHSTQSTVTVTYLIRRSREVLAGPLRS